MKITSEMIDRAAFGVYATWHGKDFDALMSPAETDDGRTWIQVYKADWDSDDLSSAQGMDRDDFRRIADAALKFGLAMPDLP